MKHREIADLSHGELAILVREYLMAGHLIDRAGLPVVAERGEDETREVAIDEWMGASPIYSTRMRQLLGYEGDTVEVALKGIQLDVGAPPEWMDFRFTVVDGHHGEFHNDYCGALLEVEPLGDAPVHTMCHLIEDPTFDATGWATHPKLRFRPIHRPPRNPANRVPHCQWIAFIDETLEAAAEPEPAKRVRQSLLAGLPIATIAERPGDAAGLTDYTKPLDNDLHMRDFSQATLRAMADEIAIQGHLLVLSFATAVQARQGAEFAVKATATQFVGTAGVVAQRLHRALRLGDSVTDIATLFDVHPAFRPRSYVNWQVDVKGESVHLSLGECKATQERGFRSWITLLAAGHDRALTAIAAAVDPHWRVSSTGSGEWIVARSSEPVATLDEVAFTGSFLSASFAFTR